MIVSDQKIKIKIENNVVNVLKKHIQYSESSSREAGGILIGKENISDNNIVIRYITEPMTTDFRNYNSFKRLDLGHIKYFNQIYECSDGIYRYIGEWHTHPEGNPKYSFVDLHGWGKIADGCEDDNEFYHIIVGFESIRIWKYEKSNLEPILLDTIMWSNINDKTYT